jgi:hypothetical protein
MCQRGDESQQRWWFDLMGIVYSCLIFILDVLCWLFPLFRVYPSSFRDVFNQISLFLYIPEKEGMKKDEESKDKHDTLPKVHMMIIIMTEEIWILQRHLA